MIRHISAVTIALCLSASAAFAQTAPKTDLTVKAASAEVHKFAMIASPVIGKVQSGTVLEITRNLGSWVEVPWKEGEGGVAFVHVSAGSIAPHVAAAPARAAAAPSSTTAASALSAAPAASTAARSASTAATTQSTSAMSAAPAQPASAPAARTTPPVSAQPMTRQPVYVAVPTHLLGLGGRVNASAPGFGGSVRKWWADIVGVQFEVSQSKLNNLDGPSRMTTMLLAPSALVSLPDAVAGGLWLRPYAGAGLTINRSKVNDPQGIYDQNITITTKGFQAFGGAEVSFPGAPRLAFSADLGYRSREDSFYNFVPKKIAFSVSGHWYVK